MKPLLVMFYVVLFNVSLFAQEMSKDELWFRYSTNQSEKDIEAYAAHPDSLTAKSLYCVANIYSNRDNYEKALTYINMSLAKDSTDASAFGFKGDVLHSLHRYDEAIGCYLHAIRIRPGKGLYYIELGDTYYAMKNTDKALECFQKSTGLEGAFDRPYYLMEKIYRERNENDKADAVVSQAKARGINLEASRAIYEQQEKSRSLLIPAQKP